MGRHTRYGHKWEVSWSVRGNSKDRVKRYTEAPDLTSTEPPCLTIKELSRLLLVEVGP